MLRKKYGIPETDDAFIREADVVVLAIDDNCQLSVAQQRHSVRNRMMIS